MMRSLRYRLFHIATLIFFAIPQNIWSQSIPEEEIKSIESMICSIKTIDPEGTVAIDGILADKSRYGSWFTSEDRIMFILKEPYDQIKQIETKAVYYNKWLVSEYDTIRSIPQEDGAPTYRPIATITNMIIKDADYGTIYQEYDSREAYRIFLEHTAIINCKKEHNRNSVYTVESELIDHITRYGYIVERQLKVYNPTVVIFANTYRYLIENQGGRITILGESIPSSNVYTMGDGKHKYYFNDKRIFIEAYHPSARINKETYCNQILEAVRRWKSEMGME